VSFVFVEDVTSDLTFVARGPTLEHVFSAAAEALLAATMEDPAALGRSLHRRLALAEPELDLLLLRFLNELVYLRDAEGALFRAERLRIASDDDFALEAELAGESIDRARHRLTGEVKAATAHGLRVTQVGDGWEAQVTLDV
jgi:SHS2 domain-containing protein